MVHTIAKKTEGTIQYGGGHLCLALESSINWTVFVVVTKFKVEKVLDLEK